MQKSNKKMMRILAVILTLTMLMSAMMVQAFAAQEAEEATKSSVSGTFLNYPAFTEIWATGDTGYIYASSGYIAGIEFAIRVGFTHPSIWIGDIYDDK